MTDDARARVSAQAGYTIIEVMAAMMIMLVGVLGTFVLIEGGLTSSNRTAAREQGTNLARDLVERTRQSVYADMTYAGAPAMLRGRLPASDVGPLSGSTFTVTRRHTAYSVTVFACSIDDPTDGAGAGDATFCATPDAINHPGSPTPGLAAAVNVLGVPVTAAGSLLDTVCQALGNDSTLLTRLNARISRVAPLSVCSALPGGTVAYDSYPDDLRRVRVDVSWTSAGTPNSVSQTTLLTNPAQS